MKYIEKLTATLALAAALTTTGVAVDAVINKNDTVNLLAEDCAMPIDSIYSISAQQISDKYYVIFNTHHDDGTSGGYYTPPMYKNHTDFVVKYQVSQEDYQSILSLYNRNGYILFRNMPTRKCDIINNIICHYNYDSIETIIREDSDMSHEAININ